MSRTFVCLTFFATLCVCVRSVSTQATVELVAGAEFAAGANLIAQNVKAEGTIFMPDGAIRVRAVIVLVESWPGPDRGVFDESGRKVGDDDAFRPRDPRTRNAGPGDLAVGRFRDEAWRRLAKARECALLHLRLGTIRPEAAAGVARNGFVIRNGISTRVIRNAAEGGGDALLRILQRLGEDSGHEELKNAPLVLWGWSAPASFGTTFAELYPGRTVAFIRYHTHRRGMPMNMKVLRFVPALLIAGSKDEQAGTADAEELWKSGRSVGAPWTFAVEPRAIHASEESGWLGNNHSTEIAPHATFRGEKESASWLSDEVTAHGWQMVMK